MASGADARRRGAPLVDRHGLPSSERRRRSSAGRAPVERRSSEGRSSACDRGVPSAQADVPVDARGSGADARAIEWERHNRRRLVPGHRATRRHSLLGRRTMDRAPPGPGHRRARMGQALRPAQLVRMPPGPPRRVRSPPAPQAPARCGRPDGPRPGRGRRVLGEHPRPGDGPVHRRRSCRRWRSRSR